MAAEPVEYSVTIPWWVSDAIADRTPGRVHFITGGLGAGKSYGAQIWDIRRCLENAAPMRDLRSSQSWTVAPNYRISETLFDLTLQVAQEVFRFQEGKHFKIMRSFPRELDFSPMGCNHRLRFLSADRPEHFVSESLTHFRWTEAGVSKDGVFDKLMDRRRDKRAKALQAMVDGTPEGLGNEYAELANFFGETEEVTQPDGRVVRYRNVDRKRNFRRFIVHTEDNAPHLAPGYLDQLVARYGFDKKRLLSYTEGHFTNFSQSNSAFWDFRYNPNVDLTNPEPHPALPVLLGFDWNKSPLAWVSAQKVAYTLPYSHERRHRWVFVRETEGNARGTMDACAELASKHPLAQFRHTPIHIFGGHDGYFSRREVEGCDFDQVRNYLRSLGYTDVSIVANRSAPGVRASLEKTAALMAYQYVVVSGECQNLINSFIKTTLKPGTWDIEKPQGDDWTHFSDAARYILWQETQHLDITNPDYRKVYGAA